MKKSVFLVLIFGTICIFLISCATGGSNANLNEQARPVTVNPDLKTIDENGQSPAAYKIGKGDVLEIITWKEPDFSREAPVRMDGMISFPLLKDIPAAGRTTFEIENEIRSRLNRYVTHPVVSVSVKSQGSKKFYIIGEVQNPGEYPFEKDLTVLQALALSGGLTEKK